MRQPVWKLRYNRHVRPAAERDGDWFGATVNIAARVSGLAGGGDVFLTEATLAAAGELAGVEVRELGRNATKNVTEPMLLYAAIRAGERSDEGLPIDPVCRMAVDPARAAGRLDFNGVEYKFCSLDCVQRFAAAPELYAVGSA